MTRLNSAPYDLGRTTGVCAATGEPLAPGAAAVGVLIEREEDGALERQDYSLEAWEAGRRPERLFSFWRRTVPEPNAKPKTFIDDDELLSLFEQLGESDQPRQLAFRYMLALILVRKRVLRQAGSRREGGGATLLLRPRGVLPDEAPIEVVDPGMDREAIEAATEQLGQALRGEA